MKATSLFEYSVPAAAFAISVLYFGIEALTVGAAGPARFPGPTSSQPLALSADDSLLLVANPDNNSVSLFDVSGGKTARLAEIAVGTEPNGVALWPDGSRAFVANTVSGTVTVLSLDRSRPGYAAQLATIPVGTEPYGLALTPTGRKLYVTNARSNSVSVIDTATYQVIRTIANVGFEPRGIAITNSGSDDTQETVYVTQFLALPVPGKTDGADDAKAGHVTVISAATDAVIGEVILNPLADTGFKAAGDALKRIAPPATPAPEDFKFVTGAYPNQLNGIAIRGKFAFVPNTGASPNGPVRFNVNTQSLLSVIDLAARTEAGRTINMHAAVGQQSNPAKRFITQPWAMALKHSADEAYVVSAASNIMVKLKIDPVTGAPAVQSDPTDATRVLQIPTGKNPRGIVVNSTDKIAYVMNYVSRDVTAIDLSGPVEKVVATMQSASLPIAGTPEEIVQIGKELYNTSIGEFDPPAPGQPAITGRMSNAGWGSCASCHPFGLSDNVVWIFPPGPRRTIPQHVDFDRTNPDAPAIRALNWSAERDEEEDFELNIRAVSGGAGLIVLPDGTTQDPNVNNFTPLANGNRNQLKVRGVGAWDALRAYVQKGIRAPISPLSKSDPDVVAGRQLFIQSNCQNCHGGAQWSSSKVRYTPPPDASLISGGQLIAELRNVGTFDANAFNEVRATAAAPLGAAGFSPPSLLSLFAFPQTFFHNGSVNSLEAVMENVGHRSAGTGGVDLLQTAAARRQLIQFLLSIDAATQPIAPNPPGTLQTMSAASYSGVRLAPESDAVAFGEKLAGQPQPSSSPLGPALGGTTVSVKDSSGVLRLARLFYVSPEQVNFEVPAGTAAGPATITVSAASGATFASTAQIGAIAPGIFTVNGTGKGVAAALAIRAASDGSQAPIAVFNCTSATSCSAVPIDLSSGDVFVSFYGTGIRNRSSLANVRCTIGGVEAPVSFAGAHSIVGLDQINVQVPNSLKGRGEVPVQITVDGLEANPVTLTFQ